MFEPAVRIRPSVAASSWSATMNRNLVNERFAPMPGWPLLMRTQFSYRHQVTKPKVPYAAACNRAHADRAEALCHLTIQYRNFPVAQPFRAVVGSAHFCEHEARDQ